jgi:hypothetical protein
MVASALAWAVAAIAPMHAGVFMKMSVGDTAADKGARALALLTGGVPAGKGPAAQMTPCGSALAPILPGELHYRALEMADIGAHAPNSLTVPMRPKQPLRAVTAAWCMLGGTVESEVVDPGADHNATTHELADGVAYVSQFRPRRCTSPRLLLSTGCVFNYCMV